MTIGYYIPTSGYDMQPFGFMYVNDRTVLHLSNNDKLKYILSNIRIIRYVLVSMYMQTQTAMNIQGIEQQIRKEDKSGLAYILQYLNTNFVYMTYDHYKKAELLELVMKERNNWHKLSQFNTFKQYFV